MRIFSELSSTANRSERSMVFHAPGLAGGMCAWEQARSERCKSSLGRCPLPVAEGNCVAARRGGEQPEANLQSVVKRTRFGRALRRASIPRVKSTPGMSISGSLLRWVGSIEATAGRVGWLVTECRKVRAVLTRETCSGRGGCSLRLFRVRRAP